MVQEIGLTSSATENASPSRQPVDPEPSCRSRMYVRNVVRPMHVQRSFLTHTINSFTSSVYGATLLITITGFAWAIATWAPFSLVSQANFITMGLCSHVYS